MRTDQLAKIALTVAAVSLIANYVQLLHARAQAEKHQMEMARLHIEYRKDAMLARATAFHELVLGSKHGVGFSASSGVESDAYKVEYAVRIPQLKQHEFLEWMAGAEPREFSVPARRYSHESAARLVREDGRDVEELYEKFSLAVR